MSATAFQRRRRELGQEDKKKLLDLTIEELKVMCKSRGLKGYSKLNELELVKLLEGED